jgi:DNA-binding GntR family transcriptional regulator
MSQMPLPKYHQIYLLLRQQLQDGRYVQMACPASSR